MNEYISKNDLLNTINTNISEAHNERCSQLLETILNAPSADVVEVKHGEWKWDKRFANYTCSLCNNWDLTTPNYCSDCGAKMDGENNV
jgi:hypothetical protein